MSARAAEPAALSRPHPLLTLFTLGTVGALVVLPIVALVVHGLAQGPAAAFAAIIRPEASAALLLTLGLALATTLCNGVVGLGVAWALVRWEFPGKGLLAALVDLPLSVPTLVAGFLIVALYGPVGPLAPALGALDLQVIYARPALLLALLFITFPFVVRAVEPVLSELDPTEEAAAATLGAAAAGRRMVAVYIGLFMATFLVFFYFTGVGLLAFFGISMPAFRIAGGIILFILGLDMVRDDFTTMFADAAEGLAAAGATLFGVLVLFGMLERLGETEKFICWLGIGGLALAFVGSIAAALIGFIAPSGGRLRVLVPGKLLGRGPYRSYSCRQSAPLLEGILGSIEAAADGLGDADRGRSQKLLEEARQKVAAGSFHEATLAAAEALAIFAKAVQLSRSDDTVTSQRLPPANPSFDPS